jgi:SpoVK/Ycf46/Vps4 family AAA+-type ATPase
MTKIIEDRNKKEDDKEEYDEKLTEKELKHKIKKRLKEKMEMPKNTNKLTLSGLLNAIDGIFNNDGRIMIMTTNHPEVLDDALIRPGRIDRKILLNYCNTYQINGIFRMMYDDVDLSTQTDIADKLKMISEHTYSPAEITSLFLRYRGKPADALNNLHELDNEKFAVTERKFFGKEVEKLMKIEQVPNGMYQRMYPAQMYADAYEAGAPVSGMMRAVPAGNIAMDGTIR